MTATHFAVSVTLGGRERRLVCNLRALLEIKEATGKSVLRGENPFEAADEGQWAKMLAALLRKSEPEITADAILDEWDVSEFPGVMRALGPLLNPDGKKSEGGSDPLAATTATSF